VSILTLRNYLILILHFYVLTNRITSHGSSTNGHIFPTQLRLLTKNVSKSPSSKLTPTEVLELRDLKGSVTDLTWDHWLSLARKEKKIKKKKIKKKKKKKKKKDDDSGSESSDGDEQEAKEDVEVDEGLTRMRMLRGGHPHQSMTNPLPPTPMIERKQPPQQPQQQPPPPPPSSYQEQQSSPRQNEQIPTVSETHELQDKIASLSLTNLELESSLSQALQGLRSLQDEFKVAREMSSHFNVRDAALAGAKYAVRRGGGMEDDGWRVATVRSACVSLRQAIRAAKGAAGGQISDYFNCGADAVDGMREFVKVAKRAEEAMLGVTGVEGWKMKNQRFEDVLGTYDEVLKFKGCDSEEEENSSSKGDAEDNNDEESKEAAILRLKKKGIKIREQHTNLAVVASTLFGGFEDDLKKFSCVMGGVMASCAKDKLNSASADSSAWLPGSASEDGEDSCLRRSSNAKGDARVIANITLPAPSIYREQSERGLSNVKFSGNTVHLGILNRSKLDVLRVGFSRVLATTGVCDQEGCNEGAVHQKIVNQKVIKEVRPSVQDALSGAGPGQVVIGSVGAGRGGMRDSGRFLEGREGDSGLMYEVGLTVFDHVKNFNLRVGGSCNWGKGNIESNGVSLKVEVSAVEVCEGERVDLLRKANNGNYDEENTGCHGTDVVDEDENKELRVELHKAADFSKLIGVITSTRNKRKRQSYSHAVVKLHVLVDSPHKADCKTWCTIIFLDLCVPTVDGSVLFANEIYDDPSIISYSGGDMGRDYLYAQEDSSEVGDILGRRISENTGDANDYDIDIDFDTSFIENTKTELVRAVGRNAFSTGSIRVFVHINGGRRNTREETKEAASAMLFSCLCSEM